MTHAGLRYASLPGGLPLQSGKRYLQTWHRVSSVYFVPHDIGFVPAAPTVAAERRPAQSNSGSTQGVGNYNHEISRALNTNPDDALVQAKWLDNTPPPNENKLSNKNSTPGIVPSLHKPSHASPPPKSIFPSLVNG